MDTCAPLSLPQLSHRVDPAQIPFDSTQGVTADEHFLGQEAAARALAFGIGVAGEDYNVFVMGPAGTGRHTLVRAALARHAAQRPPASDWVYVHNFDAPHRPVAIELPAGVGPSLRDDMQRLVGELRAAIPAIFESEEYSNRVEKIDREIAGRRDALLRSVGSEAEEKGLSLIRTPVGYVLAPTKDGEVVDSEAFARLPEEERERISTAITGLQERLEEAIRESTRGRKERVERLRELDREMALLVLEPLVVELVRRYEAHPKVVGYLRAAHDDMVKNADMFRAQPEGDGMSMLGAASDRGQRRYSVNVLVDRDGGLTPEVVFCDHPTYANLVGRIEHLQHLGTLVTDFTLLKGGALHRANGGYLVVDALRVLQQPFAWDALKRALQRREIRLEPVSEAWGITTTSLEPDAVPLRLKVVLIGERPLYYLLQSLDPDFPRLFKVVADFEDAIDRTPESCAAMARKVASIGQRAGLLPADRGGVARALDEAVRRAEDSRKLSTDMSALARLMREADFLAREARLERIGAAEVDAAARAQRSRSGRLKRRVDEAIARGTLLIDTAGTRVGQLNALSVVEVGEFPFAEPTRITATTRVGDGRVIDIQREARLSGAIHAKGVLILSQFLAARFSGKHPHSLSASLAFEQTYGPVEGDSASLAELCALLSSLAGVPLRQSLAVTGSVDQLGDVQAVGGVNEKVEGFFDVCRARGLDGSHGVIIPWSNVDHLMLDEPVVRAAESGLFRVYPVRTVDEAMELLTGLPAGSPDVSAPPDTINGRAARRLREFAQARVHRERPPARERNRRTR